MTGKELLRSLQLMDSNELSYTVLISYDGGWTKLDAVTKDFDSKTLDLKGEGNES